MLAANLVGLGGIAGIATAVGGLTTNWWWALLIISIAAVLVSVVAGLDAQAQSLDEQPQQGETPAPPVGGGGVASAA